MKRFEIFKPGKHTAASGQVIEFTEAMLRDAVAGYDPAVHEAPIVVGHPRANGPAYGWVKALDFADSGAIVVDTQQVDADFAEMVSAGRFKKRSASWYLPDAPNNPKPGTLYLRHVGFLGAQPPAIKGLKEVEFNEAEEGVVEFVDNDRYAWGSVHAILRNLRDWIIGKDGLETADKLLPNFYLSDLDAAARKAIEEPVQLAAAMPAFSEEDPMKIEELQAQVAALTAERDALKANQKPADFAERETSLAAREAALAAAEQKAARVTMEARVDAVVAAGRLLPAQKRQVVDFAMGLGAVETVVDFGEGDKTEKLTQREAYLRQIEAAPKIVDYGERAPAGGAAPGGDEDPAVTADKARALIAKAQADGRTLSFTEAVAEVMASDAA